MFQFDAEFIRKLQQQNESAFNQLYMKTVDIFFRYLKSRYNLPKAESEDLLSTLYLKLRQNLPWYQNSGSFEAFIWTVFKNLLKDYFKKQQDIAFTTLDEFSYGWDDEGVSFQDQLVADDDLLAQFEQTFHIDQITQTLGHLDFQTQDILLLKFGEGRSYEEIAPLVGLQPDNVRQKAFRGLKKLKQLLSQLSEER